VMYIQTTLKERPDSTVIFDTDNVTRIDLTGDVAGVSLKGHAGQIRISKADFDRLRMHFKVQVSSDMPCPVRHKNQ